MVTNPRAFRLRILLSTFPASEELLALEQELERICAFAEVTVSEVPGQPTIRVRET